MGQAEGMAELCAVRETTLGLEEPPPEGGQLRARFPQQPVDA